MSDPRTDRIAREAAVLIERGQAESLDEAIRLAADSLRLHDAPLPGHGRVRRHAQAMTMQALGDAGYAAHVRSVLAVAEEVMSALELWCGEMRGVRRSGPILLVGRAANGHVDAGATVNIRIYTRLPIGEIAGALVDVGYEEPTFETIGTRHGRLNRLRFVDDGVEVLITRCLPDTAADAGRDLFTGKPIAVLDLEALRKALRG
jgi:hypothetical protein